MAQPKRRRPTLRHTHFLAFGLAVALAAGVAVWPMRASAVPNIDAIKHYVTSNKNCKSSSHRYRNGSSCAALGDIGGEDGLRKKIVHYAASQVGYTEQGNNSVKFNNHAKGSRPWCSWFAVWTWRKAGAASWYHHVILHRGYSGNVGVFGQRYTSVIYASSGRHPKPGDAVIYGTGFGFNSDGTLQSKHIGIVEKVFDNGDVQTIEGNAGPSSDQVYRKTRFNPREGGVYAFVSPIYQ